MMWVDLFRHLGGAVDIYPTSVTKGNSFVVEHVLYIPQHVIPDAPTIAKKQIGFPLQRFNLVKAGCTVNAIYRDADFIVG